MWLNAELRSPYDYWQFWRNTEDADVGRFLKLFTDLSLDEVARLEALRGAEINEAKKVLANAVTALLHGRAAAEAAEGAARAAFEDGAASADLPSFEVPRATLEAGVQLAALVADAGLVRVPLRGASPGPGRGATPERPAGAGRPAAWSPSPTWTATATRSSLQPVRRRSSWCGRRETPAEAKRRRGPCLT